jgi:predicted nuclease with TOPRIM domain
MATQKKATVKKAPVRKVAARKLAPKTAVRKSEEFSLKNSAERVVNIYLGVIGTGYDRVQENLDSARKENEKRMKDLEKRGAKLRKELGKNIDKLEAPEFDELVEDVKGQFSKLQDQLEDAVENMRDKLTPAKAA